MIKYLMCVGGGVALGYFIAFRKLERAFEERLDQESIAAREHYRQRYMKKAAETEKRVDDAMNAIKNYQGIVPSEPEPEVTVETPFEDDDPSVIAMAAEAAGALVEKVRMGRPDIPPENSSDELPKPKPEIIPFEEFVNSGSGYVQFSLTYFVGDDVLSNESDKIVDEDVRNATIGPEIMAKLKAGGAAMNGLDLLCVRNHEYKTELEIARHEDKYSVVVGGQG